MPLATPRIRSSAALASLVALALSAGIASAVPVLGFVEHFAGTSVGTWSSGNGFSNPGAGGALGAGDGFLLMTTPGQNSNLGATGTGPEYTGDWTAAGITGVRMQLNDVGVDDPLEIHVSVGNTSNLWQYNTGFIPPLHAWSTIFVDLRSQSDFTQIIGLGTFAAAKAGVNRLLVRHDNAPYTMTPDPLDGDFGLDEVSLIDIVTGVAPGGALEPQPVQLATPYPNPSSGPVAFSFRTFGDRPVTIEVVDVAGRMVRHTTLASIGAGPHLWTWDGTGDDGVAAAAGVYRVRAFDESGGTSRPLIRLAR